MLLMNKGGRIYDVPEHLTEKYVVTNLSSSREVIGDMLSTLRNPTSVSLKAECGCCNVYSNYCPNN
jgi:hypothetical protein